MANTKVNLADINIDDVDIEGLFDMYNDLEPVNLDDEPVYEDTSCEFEDFIEEKTMDAETIVDADEKSNAVENQIEDNLIFVEKATSAASNKDIDAKKETNDVSEKLFDEIGVSSPKDSFAAPKKKATKKKDITMVDLNTSPSCSQKPNTVNDFIPVDSDDVEDCKIDLGEPENESINTTNTYCSSTYNTSEQYANSNYYQNTSAFTYETDKAYSSVLTGDVVIESRGQRNTMTHVWGKKLLSFVVILVLVIGVPIILGLSSQKEASNDKNSNNSLPTINVASEEEIMGTDDIFSVASASAYDTLQYVDASTRFETLDDLTLYISSSAGTILSNEKQAVSLYYNGQLTIEEFNNIMDDNISQIDNLNHLLISNKQTYINDDKYDTYQELSEDVDAVLVYGDTMVYNINNDIDDVNMLVSNK